MPIAHGEKSHILNHSLTHTAYLMPQEPKRLHLWADAKKVICMNADDTKKINVILHQFAQLHPPWKDLHQNWHGVSSRGRNQLRFAIGLGVWILQGAKIRHFPLTYCMFLLHCCLCGVINDDDDDDDDVAGRR